MSKFVIETGIEPPLSKKYSQVTTALLKAGIDEWVRITGFEDVDKLMNAQRCIMSGKRSISARLKTMGLYVQTRTDKANLALFVRKIAK